MTSKSQAVQTKPSTSLADHAPAPGTETTRRFQPKLRYELIGCGLHGHELLGTNAAKLRPKDALFARQTDNLRWYRCLRCDSWLPLPLPVDPSQEYPAARSQITLPLRGKPLRDRYLLRLIALDRIVHVVLFSALATALLAFSNHETALRNAYNQILTVTQGGTTGPANTHPLLDRLSHVFTITPSHLRSAALILIAYAVLEAAEAVGLWLALRWAEYLTFIATIALVPLEIHELIVKFSILKVGTLIINIAIAVYLLLAKRLFGLRGGGKYEAAERRHDTGWAPIERATPGSEALPVRPA